MKRRRVLSIAALAVATIGVVAVYVLTAPHFTPLEFPEGKSFAFSIIDDTDGARTADIQPVYDLLDEAGLRTTKTVWVLPGTDTIAWSNRGESLRDSTYRAFILDLRDAGFEIASHGARGGSSRREQILAAMEEFRAVIGYYPRTHVNHFENQDDVYWGGAKLAVPPYRWFYAMRPGTTRFEGHDPDSEWFWGDFLQRHVQYVVNFSFLDINLLNSNPAMPYHLPEKPYVNFWFHTVDGGDADRFNELLRPENLDQLEREGGVSIIYTHFSAGFTRDGELDPTFRRRIQDVASRDGWFVPVGELLDFLRAHGRGGEITLREKIRIETLWLWEKLRTGRT